jgi:molecular chaperone DnaK
MTKDLLDRTAFTTRQTLQAAGLEWKDIDRVLLVGGSSRMPAVVEMLRQLSGKEPDCSVSPDEAVAHGAALHAGLILAYHQGKSPSFQIRNVNSHSLGVVALDSKTRRSRNAILIPRNTPLPVVARRVFKTQKLGQKSILVQIVEGESLSPDDCSQLGKCSVRRLPADLPAQTPIEVRFRYEENGCLTVNVQVEGTDKQLQHEITRENSLTQDQLDSWRKYVSGLDPATPEPVRVPPAAPVSAAARPAAAPQKTAAPTAAAATKAAAANAPAAKAPAAAKAAAPLNDTDLASIAAEALDMEPLPDDDEPVDFTPAGEDRSSGGSGADGKRWA